VAPEFLVIRLPDSASQRHGVGFEQELLHRAFWAIPAAHPQIAEERRRSEPGLDRHDDVTIYNDAEDPLRAIAFHERAVREMIAEAGLELVAIEHGTWKGQPGPEFQDVVVLRKPRRAPAPPPSFTTRVRRKLGRVLQR